jgi:hypothetical protein
MFPWVNGFAIYQGLVPAEQAKSILQTMLAKMQGRNKSSETRWAARSTRGTARAGIGFDKHDISWSRGRLEEAKNKVRIALHG